MKNVQAIFYKKAKKDSQVHLKTASKLLLLSFNLLTILFNRTVCSFKFTFIKNVVLVKF